MKTSIGQMGGVEWEEYCQKLLKIRHHDYQKVPAKFGGDLGIEGFTFSGLVFQCYCPDEDPSGKELYEKQRDKITKDIRKLIKNATNISALGAGVIKEWHFFTPNYNSRELIAHCRTKESEVRDKNLPTIHNDFRIKLQTEDDFIPEKQHIVGTGGYKAQPLGEDPSEDELEKLLNSENDLVVNIKRKLGKLSLAPNQLAILTKQLVDGYLIGRVELESLDKRFPATFKSLIQLKSAKEKQLSIRTLSCKDNHGTILHDILKEYENKLNFDFSNNLASALITSLSTEAISDWLGRCPLDFPVSEDINEKS